MTLYLAMEGGATRSVAGLYDAAGMLLAEGEGGPCNPVAYGMAQSVANLAALGREVIGGRDEVVTGLVGAAGLLGPEERRRFGEYIAQALSLEEVIVAGDLPPVLYANVKGGPGILALAGTGSCVLGQDGRGRTVQVGGKGALLGDEGSGYRLAESALRAAARAADGVGMETVLVQRLPESAGLERFDALIDWTSGAAKGEIAAFARTVVAAAEGDAQDFVAQACIDEQGRLLARQVLEANSRLAVPGEIPVSESGGLFAHSELFRAAFWKELDEAGATTEAAGLLDHDEFSGDGPVIGPARTLARRELELAGHRAVYAMAALSSLPDWATRYERSASGGGPGPALPSTEQSAAGRPLDTMTAHEIVLTMNREDQKVPAAVGGAALSIAAAIDAAATALSGGGRLVYAGAGTSGRLGVLDAAECPPTFGVAEDRVVALIAGGDTGLRSSVEGAEDNGVAAEADVAAAGAGPGDFVIGITASGTTPYTVAAIEAAKAAGACTALLCCNPAAPPVADIQIAMDTGPEVVAGSTRLKAGTATKLALNMISPGAMALAGYLYEGRMVRMRAVNEKLRQRAVRIVSELGGVDEGRAVTMLAEANHCIPAAVLMAVGAESAAEAERLFEASNGRLRQAMDALRAGTRT